MLVSIPLRPLACLLSMLGSVPTFTPKAGVEVHKTIEPVVPQLLDRMI